MRVVRKMVALSSEMHDDELLAADCPARSAETTGNECAV